MVKNLNGCSIMTNKMEPNFLWNVDVNPIQTDEIIEDKKEKFNLQEEVKKRERNSDIGIINKKSKEDLTTNKIEVILQHYYKDCSAKIQNLGYCWMQKKMSTMRENGCDYIPNAIWSVIEW